MLTTALSNDSRKSCRAVSRSENLKSDFVVLKQGWDDNMAERSAWMEGPQAWSMLLISMKHEELSGKGSCSA